MLYHLRKAGLHLQHTDFEMCKSLAMAESAELWAENEDACWIIWRNDMNLSNRRKLSDDDRMPFGKWKGRRLGEVPDHYWRWFLQQEWSSEWPGLVEYAQIVEDEQG